LNRTQSRPWIKHIEACIMLSIYAGDERGKKTVASRVIGLARTDMTDATALRDRVVQEVRVAA
jgi:hypothetical protein